jgi:aspartate carbamoyltransferase regulatory subunit
MEKKLKVAALCNGTVIDHIPTNKLFKVVTILHLDKLNNQVTVGNNLESKKIGAKGIIKITDRILKDSETNKLALIIPQAIINIISNYEVVEKRTLSLPKEIKDLVQCANPNCITNNQPVSTLFFVHENNGEITLKCNYCERETKIDKVKLL